MTKETIKIYLSKEHKKSLLEKAKICGFEGRGALISFFEKIASEEIVFMDDNLRKFAKVLFPNIT